ncbi:MAG: hypothetical protein V1866_01270 [archaeon]
MSRWERKKEKNKQIWMSLIIAGLMVFSVFGVIIGTQSNELRYGKFKFKQDNNQYLLTVDGKEMPFYTLPYESEYINVSDITVNRLKEAYFISLTFNPNKDVDNLPLIELARFDFAQYMGGKVIVSGVLESSETYANLPLIDCSNATLKTPVVVFNISDKTSVVEVDNCIFLNARGTEFIRLRDRILYAYHGVIPGVISNASQQ